MSPKQAEKQLKGYETEIFKRIEPVFLFLITGLSIFISQFIIMHLLEMVLPVAIQDTVWQNLLDASLLTICTFIILYLTIFRPLHFAYAKIRILKGLLPVCSWCKAIEGPDGIWLPIETYIRDHSHANFTHGACPDCLEKVKSEYNLISADEKVGKNE